MQLDRRRFLRIMGAGASLSLLAGGSTFGADRSRKPNIVLCMADDQGWGDMAYTGNPKLKTPHFDEMAKQAFRFDHFYAAAPVCSPTRGSVMTGRNPNRFGCFKWGRTIRPQEITIAEALKTVGYSTGHFGKWHLGPTRKGTPTNPGASGFDEWFSAPNFYDNDPVLSRNGWAVQTHGESSMVTVDAALDFIDKHADDDQPFLAVVWFGSPHLPHQAAEKYREMYPDEDKKHQNFYGEITGMDEAFGKLRQGLRDRNIEEDTILWYCSDNGGLPGVGSTGGRGHKGQIYEGGLRVPAIIEWPGHIKTPRATNIPCSTSDIYPTLLDLVGVKIEDQTPLDGISLAPLFDGSMDKRPEPIGFWDYPEPGIGTPAHELMVDLMEAQKRGSEIGDPAKLRLDSWKITKQYPTDSFPGHAAWLDWPWKLHRIQNKKGEVKLELYNLADDPDEKNNLAESEPDRVKAMRVELEKWQKSVMNSLNGKDYKTAKK